MTEYSINLNVFIKKTYPAEMRLIGTVFAGLLFLASVAAKRSLLAKRGPSSGSLLRRRLKKSSKTKKACTGTFAAPPPSPQRLCGI